MDSYRPSSSQRCSQAILHPNMDADDIVHSGPIDNSVLHQQTGHRSEAIWKPEIAGSIPQCYDKAPGMAKRSWFTNHLAQIPVDAYDETLKKYARAYLLNLIGSTLFGDKSGKAISLHFLPLLEDLDRFVNYSWGSAVLACLYSNMCTSCMIGHSQLAGAPLIIQFWCWDRLSRIGVPKVSVPVVLPPVDVEFDPALRGSWSYMKWIGPKRWGQHTTWRADVPLICYNIIEWHHTARVMRQYGFTQGVLPNSIGSSDPCHGMDRKKNRDWAVYHTSYIALWNSHHETLIDGDMAVPFANIDDPTPRMDQDVEAEDVDVQETRHTYRPDAYMIPEHLRGYVIGARDAGNYFLNSTDEYSRMGFHHLFHHLYGEVKKLTDPAIMGVDPQTITLDMADLGLGGGEDTDTHVEDAIDDQYRPSSSSQLEVRRSEREPAESRYSYMRNLGKRPRRGRGGRGADD
ncbi:hypothetical protein QQ045_012975 [Rhodiola kirilowii]